MYTTFEAVRAEALFASPLQPSDRPVASEVRQAVAATLRRLRIQGCAVHLAGDFGDHPETAAARMRWALGTVRAAYPAHPLDGPRPQGRLRPLAVTAERPGLTDMGLPAGSA